MILKLLKLSSSVIRCFSTTQYFPSSYSKCQESGVQEDGEITRKRYREQFLTATMFL